MYEFLEYRVLDVMTRPAVTIAPGTPLREVEALFEAHDFNALPVVGSDGELVGIVSKLDLLRAFRFTEESLFPPYDEIMERPAETVMRRRPETVRQRTPLTRVLERMIETRHKSFPVVDDHHVIGMVAREDVLRGLRRAVAGEKPTTPI